MRMRILLGLLLSAAVSSLWATTIIVDAKANIFLAGQSSSLTEGQGQIPTLYPYAVSSALPYVVLNFTSTSGTVACSPGSTCSAAGTEGTSVYSTSVTNVSSWPTVTAGYNGISGISMTGRIMFLVGVYLPAPYTPTPGSHPASLSYSSTFGDANNPNAQTDFHPLIGQTFFMGDGLANNLTGSPAQHFYVPAGATRLFLGFADQYTDHPGAYADNWGSLTVTTSGPGGAVPEPTTVVLVSTALAGLLWSLRKRAA